MKYFSSVMIFLLVFMSQGAFINAAESDKEQQWQDESIYYIMVDRFMNATTENDADSNLDDPKAYHGGDIQGIIDQLDHIKELGFTAIELSPIMNNGPEGFHGFWIEDFRSVDEHFGTMEDAERLVKEAHKRDMKVIFDMVIGHTASNHPWLDDQGKKDWYTGEVKTDTQSNRWLEGLPTLNFENPEVEEYLLDTAQLWVEKTEVDGFRFYSSSQKTTGFIEKLNEVMSSKGKDLFLMTDNSSYLEQVDGIIDNVFFRSTREAFKQSGTSLDNLSGIQNNQINKTQNHTIKQINNYTDVRFTHLAVKEGHNPITRLKLGLTYMFTTPGIPVLYYGTEVPLDDGGDVKNLPMMNFKSSDEQLKQRIEKLTSMRGQFPAMTKGTFEEMHNQNGMVVYKRNHQDSTMIIAINNAEETQSTDITGLKDNQQLRGLLQDGLVRQQKDGNYRLAMARETADVFVVEPDKGYNWLFIGFVGGVLSLFVIAVTVLSLKSRKS